MVGLADALVLNRVSFSYGDKKFIDNLSKSFDAGKIHALLGRSGSGKTTLLKLAMGTLSPATGIIRRPNVSRDMTREVGYVAQDYGLFDWYTVADNIHLGLGIKRKSSDSISKVNEIAARLDIGDVLERYPKELSGGMRQRCSVARALIGSPVLLCMDEPFSALDVLSREKSKSLLREVQAETSITTMFVSHDIHDAVDISDFIHIVSSIDNILKVETILTSDIDTSNPVAQLTNMF